MPQYSDALIDFDLVPPTHVPTQPTDEVQDGQHGTSDIDTHTQVKIDDDVHKRFHQIFYLEDLPESNSLPHVILRVSICY